MSTSLNLTGRWLGHYQQHHRVHPIAAEFVHAGERLTGSMRDQETQSEYSVFQVAAEAGLPPGADEQIVAALREMVPDAPSGPIRYVSHLPPESALEGRVNGNDVYFLKTYQGASFGGYRVGDKLVGQKKAGHSVHYRGQLRPDATEIEGVWWIEADPDGGTRRTEGLFTLRRQEGSGSPAEQAPSESVPGRHPWWRFW
jgi:hypothetical protein